MKELLESIVRLLVNDPDSVRVEEVEGERSTTLKLYVAQDDMGRVIGKEGRIAKSLRILMKAASRNESKPVYIYIV